MTDPSGAEARTRLTEFAQHALRARRLARMQLLAVAAFVGGAGVYAIASGVVPAGGATSGLSGGIVATMAVLVYLAVAAPPRWLGPADPIVELDAGEGSLRVVTSSGRALDLAWRDPEFDVRTLDFTHTTSRTRNVVRIQVGRAPSAIGGIGGDDLDRIVHAARAHGLAVSTYRRPWGVLGRDQFVTETVIRPHVRRSLAESSGAG